MLQDLMNIFPIHTGILTDWQKAISRELTQSFLLCQAICEVPSLWDEMLCLLCYFSSVLVRVSIPAQTSWPRSKLGRKGFIELTLPCCCFSPKEVRTGTQTGQEAGADAEAMEGRYLLACFPWLAQPALLQNPRAPAQRWNHPQGTLLTWSLFEKMPHSWISWRHFPNWSSFLCDNSSLCQVDTQN